MNEIEKVGEKQLAWNGKSVKSSEEQIVRILAPMFAAFPQTKADKFTIDAYVMMLQDIAPERLAEAVRKAMANCKFLPTIAEIREQIESRLPGPRNDVDPMAIPDIPTKMFRLDDEEDRRQRLERLRQTRGWDKYYL